MPPYRPKGARGPEDRWIEVPFEPEGLSEDAKELGRLFREAYRNGDAEMLRALGLPLLADAVTTPEQSDR